MLCFVGFFVVLCCEDFMYVFPAVALMAAAPQDLHINIEERPLLETQVNI